MPGIFYINAHTHQASTDPNIWALQSLFPHDVPPLATPFSIGLHPWHLEESTAPEQWALVQEKAALANCLAIGECGLDRLKGPNMDMQLHWLSQHVALAESLRKPVVVHCVRAFDLLLGFLKKYKPKTPIIVHGFSQDTQMLLALGKYGALPSFGLSAMQHAKTQASLSASTRFFLETDTDAPAHISELYVQVAHIKGISVQALANSQMLLWQEIFDQYL